MYLLLSGSDGGISFLKILKMKIKFLIYAIEFLLLFRFIVFFYKNTQNKRKGMQHTKE